MQAGVSYFGCRDLHHVRADLGDMLYHSCAYVVHCVTEADLAFHRRALQAVAAATREMGLEA